MGLHGAHDNGIRSTRHAPIPGRQQLRIANDLSPALTHGKRGDAVGLVMHDQRPLGQARAQPGGFVVVQHHPSRRSTDARMRAGSAASRPKLPANQVMNSAGEAAGASKANRSTGRPPGRRMGHGHGAQRMRDHRVQRTQTCRSGPDRTRELRQRRTATRGFGRGREKSSSTGLKPSPPGHHRSAASAAHRRPSRAAAAPRDVRLGVAAPVCRDRPALEWPVLERPVAGIALTPRHPLDGQGHEEQARRQRAAPAGTTACTSAKPRPSQRALRLDALKRRGRVGGGQRAHS